MKYPEQFIDFDDNDLKRLRSDTYFRKLKYLDQVLNLIICDRDFKETRVEDIIEHCNKRLNDVIGLGWNPFPSFEIQQKFVSIEAKDVPIKMVYYLISQELGLK